MEGLLKKLRALGEPSRLRIVTLLWRGELTVSELVRILGQSQPRVSRHLKMLVDAGLAERLPEGSWVFYRLAKSDVGRKLAALIEEIADSGDPDLARDGERLNAVKQERAEAAKAYFERVASDWERIRAVQFPEADVEAAMREAAGSGPFELHLDIGTGTGRMLEVFAGRAKDGVGVDLSHEMLNLARSNIARAGLSDRFVRQADACALPIDSAAADLVTVHQVLHVVEDPVRVIDECARVLKPGGRVVIADFAPHALEWLRERHHHRRLGFAPEEICDALAAAGLAAAEPVALAPETAGDERLTVLVWAGAKPEGEAAEQNSDQSIQEPAQ